MRGGGGTASYAGGRAAAPWRSPRAPRGPLPPRQGAALAEGVSPSAWAPAAAAAGQAPPAVGSGGRRMDGWVGTAKMDAAAATTFILFVAGGPRGGTSSPPTTWASWAWGARRTGGRSSSGWPWWPQQYSTHALSHTSAWVGGWGLAFGSGAATIGKRRGWLWSRHGRRAWQRRLLLRRRRWRCWSLPNDGRRRHHCRCGHAQLPAAAADALEGLPRRTLPSFQCGGNRSHEPARAAGAKSRLTPPA